MDPSGGVRDRRPVRAIPSSREPAGDIPRSSSPVLSTARDKLVQHQSRKKTGCCDRISAFSGTLLSLLGFRVTQARALNGASVVTISAASPLGVALITASIVFILPLFLCAPPPLFSSGPSPPTIIESLADSAPDWLSAALPPSLLPAPRANKGVCTRSDSGLPPDTLLPLPACSPLCSALYTTRRAALSAGARAWEAVGAAGRVVGLEAVGERVGRVLAQTPPWPLFRIGEPILNLIQNFIHSAMPADKKLLMYSTSFMQTAVIRASAKLYLSDHIHKELAKKAAQELERQPAEVQERYRGREHAFPLPTSLSYVPLSTLARATCASEPHLRRLLRAAQIIGLYEEGEDDMWKQTAMSDLLRRDHPRSFRSAALMFGAEQYVAFSSLHLTIRSGAPAFSEIYGDFWRYHDLSHAEWAKFESDSSVNEDFESPCRPLALHGAAQAEAATKQALAAPAAAGGEQQGGKNDGKVEASKAILPYHLTSPTSHSLHTPSHKQAAPVLNNVATPMMFASPEFNGAMTSIAASEGTLVASDGPFAALHTLVDVAGGRGHLLFETLAQHRGVSTGILFDLPRVFADDQATSEVHKRAETLARARRSSSAGCRPTAAGQKGKGEEPALAQGVAQSLAPKGGAVMAIALAGPTGSSSSSSSIISEASGAKHECGRVVVRSGSFFEPETIPRAHAVAATTLRGKVQRALGRLQSPEGKFALKKVAEAAAEGARAAVGSMGAAEAGKKAKAAAAEATRIAAEDGLVVRGDGAIVVEHNAAYTMMQILHDWNDEQSVDILKSLRPAMLWTPSPDAFSKDICCGSNPDGSPAQCDGMVVPLAHGGEVKVACPKVVGEFSARLLIVDRILSKKGTLISTQGSNFADCLMMNNFNDAKERHVDDMARLAEKSGFRMLRVLPTRSMYGVVVSEPVQS